MSRRREQVTHRDASFVLDSLLTASDWDEIHDDDLNVDPWVETPPSRRSDNELARVLALLDSLDGKEDA